VTVTEELVCDCRESQVGIILIGEISWLKVKGKKFHLHPKTST
jgi:hypothetical protein